MNVKILHCVFVSIALAVLSYLVVQFLSSDATAVSNASITVAIGVFVSGIVVPLIANMLNSPKAIKVKSAVSRTDDVSDGEITTLYVGNLPYRANEDAVKTYFQDFAHVQSVRLMKDKRTGKRKGYGFVEVIAADVTQAIDALNDSVFQDRTLKVRHAKDKVAH